MSSGASYVVVDMPKPGNWAKRGHCAGSPDPDLWFADDKTNGSGHHAADVELAKQICRGCPSRTECLIWALKVPKSQDFGVWGGTTALEREQMRRKGLTA